MTAPPPPRALEDLGISADSLEELILKTLHQSGTVTAHELSSRMGLSYLVIDDLVGNLRRHQWVEVRGSDGSGRSGYQLALSQDGRARAREALARCSYVGPAPISLQELTELIERQSIRDVHVTRDMMRSALDDLTLPEDALRILGPALNSGRSFFLYGPPGNGKTAIATRLGGMFGEPIYLPHAVEVDGEIITVYDAAHHREVPLPAEEDGDMGGLAHDGRFVRVQRPVMITSGELQLDDLDLRFDPVSRVYRAPAQLKAMGGALVLDDFGRQRASPAEILSRWILPLEYGADYLTLHTGFKFEIPFDCLLVFASNLDPEDLVDEAFLRRIQYKIEMGDPDRASYERIFAREAARLGMPYRVSAVDWIYSTYYEGGGVMPRGCHPRDLLRLVKDMARYEERTALLDEASLRTACTTYFAGRRALTNGGQEART
jgi:predicted ATPase with chaperone activity